VSLYKLDSRQPDIAPSSWIASSAQIIGDITIKSDASVWFNAVLRGDNENITLGEGSNVQDNCVLHTDMGYPLTIGKNCTIGHSAIVHGCTIGDSTLIGMGSVIMNGAVIGENCLIGANTLITEGTHIPDNSLVMGSPGKVKRALTPEDVSNVLRSALSYQANAQRYKTGLQCL
jgi:carbonic anhydrase/acetyltransferase-like protein (isoleucine patch superfamily)